MSDVSTLYTTVQNPLGNERFYGYLGYHGRSLASLATFTWFGSLVDYMAGGKPTNKRKTDALQRDILATPPNILIVSTPSPIVEDTVTKALLAVKSTSGTLGTLDPSWGAGTGP